MNKKLIKKLKDDKEFYYGWQSNIAIAVWDAIKRIKGYKSEIKIHMACNDGAKEFLNRLVMEARDE